MNELGLNVKIVEGNNSIILSHIPFENSAFIWPNDRSDLKIFFDQDGLIVPIELEKSTYSSGDYLIFTDVSGIADGGGWDYVKVTHKNNIIYWKVWFNNAFVEFFFSLTTYQKEITEIMNQLRGLPEKLTIQPSIVVFPE